MTELERDYLNTENAEGKTLEEDLNEQVTMTKKEMIKWFCNNIQNADLDYETVLFELQDGYKDDIETYKGKDIMEILASLMEEYTD